MADTPAPQSGKDDRLRVFGVAIAVALTCAIVVSVSSVLLRPYQEAHLEAEREARMAAMLDALPGMREIMEEAGVDSLSTRIVDLETGRFEPEMDPASFHQQAAANDPDRNVAIPSELDVADLRTRARHAPVHFLDRDGELLLVVLPVSGTGYQSTIRAMLALEADLNTIAALTITEQAETPGLGARVEDPAWLAQWPGKEIADESGAIEISVVRGQASGPHQIDGLTGATRTSNGVGNMLRYWMGDHGFGPFLDRLAEEGL
ncbi:NADH:ubiquinone reductase (Na(+)-transporting) subunit C [Pontivivens ytuae]|uniref:NADH:ubiquinone reductase (Na(+)-transporting) subunit C n=1 Tax=Pontivivens ytuae TaxID=2789856 RepID=UPI001E57FF94|nr:NADH:ubiquinone reductase (Na(+)-transporting) subunit C [Pontivivens ytuae]